MTKRPIIAEPIGFRFDKNDRKDVIAVTLQTYTPPRGDPLNVVDLRMFAMTKDGRNVPTPKGVSMSIRRLPDLLAAVTNAHAKAVELGLLDGPDDDDEATAP
jgi:hypothetical protein